MAHKKLLAVSLRWNGAANVCAHCGRETKTLYITTGHDHTDDYASLCDCGAGEPFENVYNSNRYATDPLQHYLDIIARMEAELNAEVGDTVLDIEMPAELLAPSPSFLLQLRVASGQAFNGAQVDDLDGQPLFSGEPIYDEASGLHCIVLDNERAVRQGYTAWRKNGCWRRPEVGYSLTVTLTAAGEPVCITWQDEDHHMLETLFNAPPKAPDVALPALEALLRPRGMTAENFCYWLQGRAELVPHTPSAEEWASIKEHLALVFNKVTSPAPGEWPSLTPGLPHPGLTPLC